MCSPAAGYEPDMSAARREQVTKHKAAATGSLEKGALNFIFGFCAGSSYHGYTVSYLECIGMSLGGIYESEISMSSTLARI